MTRILSIDTSNHLALALLETDGTHETLALEHSEDVGRTHAEIILERIQALFSRANLKPHADLIAVGTGPGSYTGLRVGASLALGLARAWNAQVIGVPSLEAIAVTREGRVTVSMDARRGMSLVWYWCAPKCHHAIANIFVERATVLRDAVGRDA